MSKQRMRSSKGASLKRDERRMNANFKERHVRIEVLQDYNSIMSKSWGYTKGNGPDTWPDQFPEARGLRQSPVDINTAECVNESNQRPLKTSYSPPRKIKGVVNTGYGFRVDVESAGFELSGGPLQNKFRLEQFHFHWGRNDQCGSEHTVDGNSFPAEVHLVHWNAEKYSSFGEAASKEDGLAVLGVLFEVGQSHGEIAKLIRLFPNIRHKDDKVNFEGSFDLDTLLPAKREYWTYSGSLTTPPCSETVAWIVYKQTIQLSPPQLSSFRELRSYCQCDECPDDEFGGQILENFRPPLPVNDRVIRDCAC